MPRLLLLFILPVLVHAEDTRIPIPAFVYLQDVYKEQETYIPDHVRPYYFPALIEHESCSWLLSRDCWNPSARFKTSREEGAGLGQLTRAYNKDGTIRFDSLTNLYNNYRSELSGLSWSTIYKRPDLQIRSIILLYKNDYKYLRNYTTDDVSLLSFTDSAYNSGLRRVLSDIRLCSLTEGCDPSLWENNVETTCSFSKKILYGKRSPCDINRDHVKDTVKHKERKYLKDYLKRKGVTRK